MRSIGARRRPVFEPLEGRAMLSAGLDASFGQGGQIIGSFGPLALGRRPADTAAAVAVQADGKIVVVTSGTNAAGMGGGFSLSRINPGQTPADYLGTGRSDVAIELPSQGVVAIRPSHGGADQLIPFDIAGAGNTLAAPGDYTGSGHTELGVYLPPRLGEFAIRSGTGPDMLVPFGIAGAGQSIPAPGDYEGSGKADIAVDLPSIGAYAIRPSAGGADQIIPFGTAGVGQSIPVPGDYDGSGHTELAVYLPSLGDFAYRPANGGPDVLEGFGIAGQSIAFTTDPASNALPSTVSAASVSAGSVGWIDVIPATTSPKKSTADRPVLG